MNTQYTSRKVSFGLSTLALALGMAFSVQAQEAENEEGYGEEEFLQQQEQAMQQYESRDYSSELFSTLLTTEPQFSMFYQALELTGLAEELDELENATIFAPFNEAFTRLPEGIWEAWEQGDGQDELREILTHHIIEEQRVTSEDASESGQTYATLSGENVEVSSLYGALMVDSVSVNIPDMETSQGVIHGIDAIIADTSDLQTEPVLPEPEESEDDTDEETEENQSNGEGS